MIIMRSPTVTNITHRFVKVILSHETIHQASMKESYCSSTVVAAVSIVLIILLTHSYFTARSHARLAAAARATPAMAAPRNPSLAMAHCVASSVRTSK
mmetsp:Transcript_22583/g.22858  ORF Transcript_22583/g.22858 Transcript_22583/m.22858 type:complete len:98 (+) Transcript_22583:128-421(+)